MLLFNAIFVQFHKTGTSFQYILCCYSTSTQTGNKRLFTTFISIHFILLFNWQIFNYFISLFVSIHSMLLFNFPSRKPSHKLSCCYSTEYTKMDFRKGSYFNTSYVVIQRTPSFLISLKSRPFQYIICCYSTQFSYNPIKQEPHFNISHVIIQQCTCWYLNYNTRISIHPMLLFNNAKPIILKPWTQISIHPMLLFN